MPDRAVAANARHIARMQSVAAADDGVNDRLMAMPAGLFRDLSVAFSDHYRFVKIIRSEIIRMPKTVPCLRKILIGEILRRMAIVAGSDRTVARFHPAGILLLHHVAIGTRSRVIAQVRIALCIPECIQADACRQPQPDARNDQFCQIK